MSDVVLEIPPEVPDKVTLKDPAGVEGDVLMVTVLVKDGLPDCGLKLHEALGGRPAAHARATGWVAPFSKVALIVPDPGLPCVAAIPPELESEKSSGFIADGFIVSNATV